MLSQLISLITFLSYVTVINSAYLNAIGPPSVGLQTLCSVNCRSCNHLNTFSNNFNIQCTQCLNSQIVYQLQNTSSYYSSYYFYYQNRTFCYEDTLQSPLSNSQLVFHYQLFLPYLKYVDYSSYFSMALLNQTHKIQQYNYSYSYFLIYQSPDLTFQSQSIIKLQNFNATAISFFVNQLFNVSSSNNNSFYGGSYGLYLRFSAYTNNCSGNGSNTIQVQFYNNYTYDQATAFLAEGSFQTYQFTSYLYFAYSTGVQITLSFNNPNQSCVNPQKWIGQVVAYRLKCTGSQYQFNSSRTACEYSSSSSIQSWIIILASCLGGGFVLSIAGVVAYCHLKKRLQIKDKISEKEEKKSENQKREKQTSSDILKPYGERSSGGYFGENIGFD